MHCEEVKQTFSLNEKKLKDLEDTIEKFVLSEDNISESEKQKIVDKIKCLTQKKISYGSMGEIQIISSKILISFLRDQYEKYPIIRSTLPPTEIFRRLRYDHDYFPIENFDFQYKKYQKIEGHQKRVHEFEDNIVDEWNNIVSKNDFCGTSHQLLLYLLVFNRKRVNNIRETVIGTAPDHIYHKFSNIIIEQPKLHCSERISEKIANTESLENDLIDMIEKTCKLKMKCWHKNTEAIQTISIKRYLCCLKGLNEQISNEQIIFNIVKTTYKDTILGCLFVKDSRLFKNVKENIQKTSSPVKDFNDFFIKKEPDEDLFLLLILLKSILGTIRYN